MFLSSLNKVFSECSCPHLTSNPEVWKTGILAQSRVSWRSCPGKFLATLRGAFSFMGEGGKLYLTRVVVLLREYTYNKWKRGKEVEGECKGVMIKINHGISAGMGNSKCSSQIFKFSNPTACFWTLGRNALSGPLEARYGHVTGSGQSDYRF